MGPDEPVAQDLGAENVPVEEVDVSQPDTSKTTVRTVWPHGEFIIEDTPTVTAEGVELSSAELAKVTKAAEASGVKLAVEGGN